MLFRSLFIESQHVFCDDPVVGEAADGYGKPLRQPYCSCKGDAERIIKAYLRAASKDAEPMAWIAEAGENKQPCLCWTEAVALSEAGGDRSRITPLFTHPFTGVEGGVKVKERDALIEAVADELVAHGEFSSIPGRNHANASKAAEAILPIILASIEPVAASPGVPDGWKLVPVEPTEAMMRAAMDRLGWTTRPTPPEYENFGSARISDGLSEEDAAQIDGELAMEFREVYRAVLAAAPASPEPSPSTEDVMGEARGALAIALSAIEKAGDDLQASGAYPVGALAALIVPAEQVRTAITNIDRALSSKQRSGE